MVEKELAHPNRYFSQTSFLRRKKAEKR
jgi:hypothetical protein